MTEGTNLRALVREGTRGRGRGAGRLTLAAAALAAPARATLGATGTAGGGPGPAPRPPQAKPILRSAAEAPARQPSSALSLSTTRPWVMDPVTGIAAASGTKAL